MRRRDLLIGAAGLTVAGAASNAKTVDGSDSRARGHDVIVVGGGLAGLTAARDLSRSGLRTLLVEANDRLGGRTASSMVGGHKVDIGGTWFHWHQAALWREVQRYELEVEERPLPDSYLMSISGKLMEVPANQVDASLRKSLPLFWGDESYYSALVRPFQVQYRAKELAAIDAYSVEDRMKQLDLSAFDEEILRANFMDFGRPLSDVSLAWVLQRMANGLWSYEAFMALFAVYKLKHGMESLITSMVNDGRFDSLLSSPVRKINQSADGCSVELADGRRLSSRAVVIATPASVWKTLQFSPALPEIYSVASAEGMSAPTMDNFLMLVRGVPKILNAFFPIGERPLQAIFTVKMLVGDEQIIQAVGMDAGVTVKDGKEKLEAALRQVAPTARIVDYASHYWGSDPFALGGAPSLRPRQVSRFIDVLDRSVGNFFFASGDIAPQFAGFLTGAIESGARAAHRVLESNPGWNAAAKSKA